MSVGYICDRGSATHPVESPWHSPCIRCRTSQFNERLCLRQRSFTSVLTNLQLHKAQFQFSRDVYCHSPHLPNRAPLRPPSPQKPMLGMQEQPLEDIVDEVLALWAQTRLLLAVEQKQAENVLLDGWCNISGGRKAHGLLCGRQCVHLIACRRHLISLDTWPLFTHRDNYHPWVCFVVWPRLQRQPRPLPSCWLRRR